MDLNILKKQLIRHEGKRTKPYADIGGKITIGVGRNLTDNGLSEMEIDYLLSNDIQNASDDLLLTFAWFKDLDEVRQRALVNLCFNIGLPSFLTFKKMITHIRAKEWTLASLELLASQWAKQVGNGRSSELAYMISTGKDK